MSDHFIQRQTLDISYSERNKAQELQNRLSVLLNGEFIAALEYLFDRLIPDDLIIQLDHLLIDAGNIQVKDLETDFVKQLIEALETELLTLLPEMNGSTTLLKSHSGTSFKANYLTLLEYLLYYGSFPGWVKGLKIESADQLLSQLVDNDPQGLRIVLLSSGQHSVVQQRLARQFSFANIKKTIELLVPGESGFIVRYHAQVIHIEKVQPVLSSQSIHLSTVLWEFIFTILLTESSSRFSRKAFIKAHIALMAAHFNTSYASILGLLFKATLAVQPAVRPPELTDIIHEIWNERILLPAESIQHENDSITKKARVLHTYLDTLLYFLLNGSFRPEMESDQDTLNSQFLEAVSRTPLAVKELLRKWKRSYSGDQRIRLFSIPSITAIVQLVEPVHADSIIEYHDTLSRLQQKKRLVPIDQSIFDKEIWVLILDYLFIEWGSEFNRKEFLKRTLKSVASHYNLKIGDLVKSLIPVHGLAIPGLNDSFFQVLSELSEESMTAVNSAESETIIDQNAVIPTVISYKDLLIFWLSHGTLPWWYTHSGKQVSQLFEELLSCSPAESVQVLTYAGRSMPTQLLLIQKIPVDLLIKAFTNIPGTSDDILYQLRILIGQLPSVKKMGSRLTEEIFMLSLFKAFSESGFQRFELNSLISILLHQFTVWTALNPAILIQRLSVLLKKNTFSNAIEILSALSNVSRSYGSGLVNLLPLPLNIEAWILEKTNSYLIENEETDLHEAFFSILTYFFKYNKLPESLNLSVNDTGTFIHYLMVVLLKKDRTRLQTLFLSPTTIGAKMKIHNLFARATLPDSGTGRGFLSGFLNDDLIEYAWEIRISDTGQTSTFIELLRSLPATKATDDLLKRMMKHPGIVHYLAIEYSDKEVYELIIRISPHPDADLLNLIREATQFILLGSGNSEKSVLANELRAFNLLYLFGKAPADLHTYLQNLFTNFERYLSALSGRQIQQLLISKSSKLTFSIPFLKEVPFIKESLRKELERQQVKLINEQPHYGIRPERSSFSEHSIATELKGNSVPESTPEIPSVRKPSLSQNQRFSIKNAGLVILHPLLTTYFNLLGMLENGKFIHKEAQHRAPHLLQYLVDRTSDAPESALLLNKLFSGLSTEDSIPASIELTDKEIDISRQLINVLITSWEKLNTSTPENMQASFLQREGVLTYANDSWSLRVEPRGYDMLMMTLPWGLGMIKTSWMTDFVTVEWEQI